jgi:hypothetical protein
MTDEQWVCEQLSEPSQGMARRRLGERQPGCCATDVAFREQDLKHDQQVQIDPAEIDLVHGH